MPEAKLREFLDIHEVIEDGLWNGDHTVFMKITKDIPSMIRVGKYTSYIKYRGQRMCCQYCNNWDHTVNDCRYKRDKLCNRCGDRGHTVENCKRAWVVANDRLPMQPHHQDPNNDEFPALGPAPPPKTGQPPALPPAGASEVPAVVPDPPQAPQLQPLCLWKPPKLPLNVL